MREQQLTWQIIEATASAREQGQGIKQESALPSICSHAIEVNNFLLYSYHKQYRQ